MANDTIRLQKALSDAGVASRRKAEELIATGHVTVNGRPARTGHPVNIRKDIIAIDGERVVFETKKKNYYIILNKPRGYVTTTNDELGRRCVTELVKDIPARLYPVGRLDKVSEGLLLMTNDGEFANMIMHPSNHISKTYRVTVHQDVNDEKAAMLSAGLDIGEGEVTQPCQVLILTKEPGRVVMQITISEGKNRQIRRMCEAVGLEVVRLRRTSVGPIKLGMLQPGKWRELTTQEITSLRNATKEKSGRQEGNTSKQKADKPAQKKPFAKDFGAQKPDRKEMQKKWDKPNEKSSKPKPLSFDKPKATKESAPKTAPRKHMTIKRGIGDV